MDSRCDALINAIWGFELVEEENSVEEPGYDQEAKEPNEEDLKEINQTKGVRGTLCSPIELDSDQME